MEIRVKIEPQGERAAQTKPAARLHGSEAMGAEGGVSGPRIIEGCTLLRPAVRQRFKGWQRLPRHPGNPRVHRWGNCGPRRCQELGSAMASWKEISGFSVCSHVVPQQEGPVIPAPGSPTAAACPG